MITDNKLLIMLVALLWNKLYLSKAVKIKREIRKAKITNTINNVPIFNIFFILT